MLAVAQASRQELMNDKRRANFRGKKQASPQSPV